MLQDQLLAWLGSSTHPMTTSDLQPGVLDVIPGPYYPFTEKMLHRGRKALTEMPCPR